MVQQGHGFLGAQQIGPVREHGLGQLLGAQLGGGADREAQPQGVGILVGRDPHALGIANVMAKGKDLEPAHAAYVAAACP